MSTDGWIAKGIPTREAVQEALDQWWGEDIMDPIIAAARLWVKDGLEKPVRFPEIDKLETLRAVVEVLACRIELLEKWRRRVEDRQ